MSSTAILLLMTTLFLILGYMGVPVAFSLMAGVLVGTLFTDVSFATIIQKMFDGIDSEALLAIPFFLLVGELMGSANIVVRIVNLSLALVGHIRGGLSQTVAVFSMFFSEMSGSTTADVAVMTRALGEPMKKEGYSPPFIAALIAAASTIAALVPPSITAVVYGAVGNVSIAGLFMAGVVPGLMIGFGLMIYCYFFGPEGMRRPRATFGQVAQAVQGAALPLMIPVILLGGILTGFAGVALLIVPDLMAQGIHGAVWQGFLLLQFGSATWVLGSILQKRLKTDAHPFANGAIQQFAAGLFFIVPALLEQNHKAEFSTGGLGAVFYLVTFGSIIGFTSYIYALEKLPVALVSIYTYVNPLVAAALGWLFYREPFGWRETGAMAIIFSGVWLVKRSSRH